MEKMIDAVVLIHAIGVEVGRIDRDSDYWAAARDSHHLVSKADSLAMSAVAWYEVLRGMTEEQSDLLERWKQHIHVLPLDARAAQEAAELTRKLRQLGKICPRCMSLAPASPCPDCGATPGKVLRNNDILIVATASSTTSVTHLYTHDSGMQAMALHTRPGLSVCAPPAAPALQQRLAHIDDASAPPPESGEAEES